jgi:hypothetical protein
MTENCSKQLEQQTRAAVRASKWRKTFGRAMAVRGRVVSDERLFRSENGYTKRMIWGGRDGSK